MSVTEPAAGTALARPRGFRLTRRVFWDLAVYMVGLGLAVGLVFPPFAIGLGVSAADAERPSFRVACLAAGFLVGALSYALCRCVVGGRLAVLSEHLRRVAETVGQASRTGDWAGSSPARIRVDSDDQLGSTARAFNSLLDALEDGEHFRALVRNASDVITVVDPAGTITYQTPSVAWVLGYPPTALLGTDLHALVHPEDLATFRGRLAAVVTGAPHKPCDGSRMRHRNGSWRWMETVASNLLGDPAVNGIVLTTRDVSDRKELEERLRIQAFYDPLTELPNRALFMERLRAAEELERATGTPVAVLYLDLDNLKTINDCLGHEGGDGLLRAVASRISACLRSGDTVARLAGDEFAVLLVGEQNVQQAETLAARILAGLGEPMQLGQHVCRASASLGIATSTACAVSGISLLRAADVAMYLAKTTGKGRCETFHPRHHTAVIERDQLRADLQQALDLQQFVLHYQPIVDLAEQQVTGYEALVRWQHPARGLIPPADFIALAEDGGLIVPLGRWILGEACRQAAAWYDQHPDLETQISVNVSVRQFQHPELVSHITGALRDSGLPARLLTLELTESLFADDTATTKKLREIKELGVKLALDDFGTGYSSLSYLRRFPIDVLKIDKAFVDGVATSVEDRAVVGAIVQLGETLQMTVIAEGIETVGELKALRALGVDYGQGYHLGHPVEAGRTGHARPQPAERRHPGSSGSAIRLRTGQ